MMSLRKAIERISELCGTLRQDSQPTILNFRDSVTLVEVVHRTGLGNDFGNAPGQLTNRTLMQKMRNSEQLNGRIGVASSGTSMFLATIEAVCVFFVSANGVAALVGSSGIVLAGGARFFHQAAIRLPLLSLATAIALFNLWMLLNTWRLRRAPTAQWRLRPLQASERRQTALIAALSLLTLGLVGAELFVHHKLHGSAFAGTLPTQTNRYSVSRHDFPLMRTTDIQKPHSPVPRQNSGQRRKSIT